MSIKSGFSQILFPYFSTSPTADPKKAGGSIYINPLVLFSYIRIALVLVLPLP